MLREHAGAAPPGLPPAWISEAVQDLYGYAPGQQLELPLGGRAQRFFVAGVWRDYARPAVRWSSLGPDYIAATGDFARPPRLDLARRDCERQRRSTPASAPRSAMPPRFELISSTELRERSLAAFDRAFVITYALEAVAVLIRPARRQRRRELHCAGAPRAVRHAAAPGHAAASSAVDVRRRRRRAERDRGAVRTVARRAC